jgi:hypothetical protein
MSLIATPDAGTPVDEWDEDDIANDGFFPDIVMADARDTMRIDGTVTAARLRHALVEAMGSVNDALEGWKQQQTDAGRATMGDVPSTMLDGVSRNLHRYRRAVYCYARANLIERYRDFDNTNEGNKRAEDMESAIGDLRRDALWATNDILGIYRTTVELI